MTLTAHSFLVPSCSALNTYITQHIHIHKNPFLEYPSCVQGTHLFFFESYFKKTNYKALGFFNLNIIINIELNMEIMKLIKEWFNFFTFCLGFYKTLKLTKHIIFI